MKVVIYHNPRCSKSRRTLSLLRERGLEPEIVAYLETPPDVQTLRDLLSRLGLRPLQLIRTGQPEYKALGLDTPDIDDDALLAAMTAHPILIQRPIVVAGDRACIGRPPENVLKIL